MKTGIWVGGLVLSLAGWASDSLGQEVLWKTPTAPVPIALAELELTPCPKVTLGRPVPLKPAGKRGVASSSIVPASYQCPAPRAARSIRWPLPRRCCLKPCRIGQRMKNRLRSPKAAASPRIASRASRLRPR